MTARQVFEATLIELSKVQAPALKLYEFNYLFNKAINQYINKVYNTYDLNQQTTDDLRVLKATAYLTPQKWNKSNSALHNSVGNASSYLSTAHRSIQSLHGATYEVAMPIDYLHLLNCVCIYYVAKQKDCWDAGSYIEIPATRLTADSWSQIITDIYNRPSPMKPYYYIHNQNNSTNNEMLPTDPITKISELGMPNGTDLGGPYQVTGNGGLPYVAPTDGVNTGLDISTSTTDLLEAQIAFLTAQKTYKEALANVENDPDKLDEGVKTAWANAQKAWAAATSGTGTNVAMGGTPGSNFQRTFKLDYDNDGTAETEVSLVEKPIGLRAGNTSNVRLEIRYGKIK